MILPQVGGSVSAVRQVNTWFDLWVVGRGGKQGRGPALLLYNEQDMSSVEMVVGQEVDYSIKLFLHQILLNI